MNADIPPLHHSERVEPLQMLEPSAIDACSYFLHPFKHVLAREVGRVKTVDVAHMKEAFNAYGLEIPGTKQGSVTVLAPKAKFSDVILVQDSGPHFITGIVKGGMHSDLIVPHIRNGIVSSVQLSFKPGDSDPHTATMYGQQFYLHSFVKQRPDKPADMIVLLLGAHIQPIPGNSQIVLGVNGYIFKEETSPDYPTGTS